MTNPGQKPPNRARWRSAGSTLRRLGPTLTVAATLLVAAVAAALVRNRTASGRPVPHTEADLRFVRINDTVWALGRSLDAAAEGFWNVLPRARPVLFIRADSEAGARIYLNGRPLGR